MEGKSFFAKMRSSGKLKEFIKDTEAKRFEFVWFSSLDMDKKIEYLRDKHVLTSLGDKNDFHRATATPTSEGSIFDAAYRFMFTYFIMDSSHFNAGHNTSMLKFVFLLFLYSMILLVSLGSQPTYSRPCTSPSVVVSCSFSAFNEQKTL